MKWWKQFILRFKQNRNSVIFAWFISYVIILIIPIATSFVTYLISANTIRREITNNNEYLLTQISQDTDARIQSLEKGFHNFITNENAKKMIDAGQYNYKEQQTYINNILKDTYLSSLGNNNMFTCFVYFKRLECIVDFNSKYDIEIAYEIFNKNPNLNYEEWKNSLNVVEEHNILHQSDSEISFQYPIYSNLYSNNTAVFVAEFTNDYADTIKKSLSNLQQANFMILSENNKTVSISNDMKEAAIIGYNDIPRGNGVTSIKWGGVNYVVVYQISAVSDLKYAIAIPQSNFFVRANNILYIIVVQVIFTILLGLYFALKFAKKNYKPVSKIIKAIGSLHNMEGNNEFDFIQQTVLDKIHEIENVQRKIWRNKDAIFADIVSKLLVGGIRKASEFNQFIKEYDISIYSNQFVVMIVKIEDYSAMFEDEVHEHSEEYALYVVKIALTNIIKEVANETHSALVSEMEDGVVCIFNINGENDTAVLADTMQSLIRNYLHVDTTIAISNVHEDFLSIPNCYKEASEAMEYRILLGIGNLIQYSAIVPSDEWYTFSVEQEIKIINSVRSGDFQKANEVIQEILDENHLGNLPIELCKCLMFDLSSTVIKSINAAEEISGSRGKIWSKLSPMEKLLSCQSIVEMKEIVVQTLEEVCAYIVQQKSVRGTRLKDDIIRFVNENYHQLDLNVNMIAEHFDRNPAYLSRYFKEQTGEGLLDFINHIRINRAKELLLKDKKININEIVEKVGFLNSAGFIRVFKKYEGVTPGQFKTNNKAKKNIT